MENKDNSPAEKDEPKAWHRKFSGPAAIAVSSVAVGLSLFQLYTAGIAPLTAIYQRSVHLVLIMVLAFAP